MQNVVRDERFDVRETQFWQGVERMVCESGNANWQRQPE